MRLTEKLGYPHANDEIAPSILMGWRAAATCFEPQLALPPVATRNGPAQPMRIGAWTASEALEGIAAVGRGFGHDCFRPIKNHPEIPEEPYFAGLHETRSGAGNGVPARRRMVAQDAGQFHADQSMTEKGNPATCAGLGFAAH